MQNYQEEAEEENREHQRTGKSGSSTAQSESAASAFHSRGDTSDDLLGERALGGHAATAVVDRPVGLNVPVYRTYPGSHSLTIARGSLPSSTEDSGDRRSAECHDLGALAAVTERALAQDAPRLVSPHIPQVPLQMNYQPAVRSGIGSEGSSNHRSATLATSREKTSQSQQHHNQRSIATSQAQSEH